MNRFQRFISLFLALVVCVGMLPASALAETDEELPCEEVLVEELPEELPEDSSLEEFVLEDEMIVEESEQTPPAFSGVKVTFECKQPCDFVELRIYNEDCEEVDPVFDEETLDYLFGTYILVPGEYLYSYGYSDYVEFTVSDENEEQIICIFSETEKNSSLPEPVTRTFVHVNPLYEDIVDESEISVPKGSSPATFYSLQESGIRHTSVESAGEEARRYLVDRVEEFTVYLEFRSYLSDEEWDAAFEGIPDVAMAHTGVPNEGDYLRRQYGGYGVSCSFDYGNDQYIYSFTYKFLYYTTADQEVTMDRKVESILNKLNLTGKSDYQKIKAIHDYLYSHVSYDYDHMNNNSYKLQFTGYAALINNTAVCQGIAVAFYRLCLEAGVDTRVVSCRSMNHAWNIVRFLNVYYELDATWDICEGSRTAYFLRGSSYWLSKHKNGGGSSLGDEFSDSEYESRYPVPSSDAPSCSVITYDANGGSGAPDAQDKPKNTTINLSRTVPVRASFSFAGWATSKSATSAKYQPGDEYKTDGDVTLYAVWQTAAWSEEKIEAFILRLFQTCLGRNSGTDEMAYYKWAIMDKGMSGIEVADIFVFNDEFMVKCYCDRHYTEALYKAFMGRNPSADEIDNWTWRLQQGDTREDVFNAFATSTEFQTICRAAGINPGVAISYNGRSTRPGGRCTVRGCISSSGSESFAKRLYSVCLDRNPSASEVEAWVYYLVHGDHTGTSASEYFLFSSEFQGKRYNDRAFVEHIYSAMMGRAPGADERDYWVWRLTSTDSNRATRRQVFNEFAKSDEFAVICAKYGIVCS